MEASKHQEYIQRLVDDLCSRADLDQDQALRVLQALKVDVLVENLDSMKEILENPKLARPLGYKAEEAVKASEAISLKNLTIDSIGLVFIDRTNLLKSAVAV